MKVTDLELLQKYAQENSHEAFAEVVKRHINLVYSVALRLVRSNELAEEVAQSTFTDLARNAKSFGTETVLAAWLYQIAKRTAIDAIRRETRRQSREQTAVEIIAMNATDGDWTRIEPILDEAVEELEGADRAAVLLRYFEDKSLREVGQTLGISEDAAQKRVSRAVDRLRELIGKRGVTIGAVGLVAAVSANAILAAPSGLAAGISTAAAAAGTTIATTTTTTTSTLTATKTIAMTTLQKAAVTIALAVSIGAGIYQGRQNAALRSQVETLQQQMTPLAEAVRASQQERDDATNKLAMLIQENNGLKGDLGELSRLRGEVARLRESAPAQSRDPQNVEMKSWLLRAEKLKQRLAESPGARIPEMQFLTEDDYMQASRSTLNYERDYLAALANLRSSGEFKFITTMLNPALTQYAQANNGQFPTDLAQLKPYFPSPVEDAILDRWEIAPASMVRTDNFGDPIITQKAAVDEDWDARYAVGLKGFASAGLDTEGHNGWGSVSPDTIMASAEKSFETANNGQPPTDTSQILPYLTTPEQQAAYQKIMMWRQKK
jgi:RNA polymerase sigma factor (sigma-70 family)